MQVIDDLVPQSLQDNIEQILLSHDFPWYLNKQNIDNNYDKGSFLYDEKTVDPPQFTHRFYDGNAGRSPNLSIVAPIITLLEEYQNEELSNRLLRIKANLLTKHSYESDCYNIPHIDSVSPPGVSLLYYVNDTDGDTFVFNETHETKGEDKLTLNKRVSPKKGRCLYFDSNYYHASSCPRENETRVIINFLFKKQGIS